MTPSPLPGFWQRFTALYNAGIAHCFTLHGNVHDYVEVQTDGYQKQADYLYQKLPEYLSTRLASRDLVIFVDPARGMTFPNPRHRRLFIQALRLDAPPTTQTPPNALMAAMGGQPQAGPRPVELPTAIDAVIGLLDRLLADRIPHPDPRRQEKDDEGVLLFDNVPRLDAYGDRMQEGGQLVFDRVPRMPSLTAAVVFSRADLMFPDAPVSQLPEDARLRIARFLGWARNPRLAESDLLFLVTETLAALHTELRRETGRWEQIEIARPNAEERARFIARRLERMAVDGEPLVLEEGLDVARAAQLTGVLNLEQCEDALYRGAEAGALTVEQLRQQKTAIIKRDYGPVIRVKDGRFTFGRVGGYRYTKEPLKRYTLAAINEGRMTTSGILLMGPAGTGKTQLAEALAGEAGLPFVAWSPGQNKGKYVGDTERDTERAFAAMRSLAPCLVFIDELDQVVGRGDGSNSVDANQFQAVLTFLEDPERMRLGIVIVGATNWPNRIDAAVLSRFQTRIPVLPPTAQDRADMLPVMLREDMKIDPRDVGANVVDAVVAATERFVGRDMRGLMFLASDLMRSGYEEAPTLSAGAALGVALTMARPQLADVAAMTAVALEYTSDLRFLPPEWRDRAVERQDTMAEEALTDATEPTTEYERRSRRTRKGSDL